jgi:hypothetical protein
MFWRTLAMLTAMLAGCSTGGSTDAGSDTNTMPANGSCVVMTGGAVTGCTEYRGYTSSDILAIMNGCSATPTNPGTWMSSACPHQNSYGGCQTMTSHGTIVTWYYGDPDAGGTLQIMRSTCTMSGGTFLLP